MSFDLEEQLKTYMDALRTHEGQTEARAEAHLVIAAEICKLKKAQNEILMELVVELRRLRVTGTGS